MVDRILDTEVRHIKYSKLTKLSAIIDGSKAWRQLMEVFGREDLIPDVVGKVEPLDLSPDATCLIEQQYCCGRSPTQALLNHWSITGRRRPTVRVLLKYLRVCDLKWAEDFVNKEILGVQPKDQECLPPVQNDFAQKFIPKPVLLENKPVQDAYIFEDLPIIIKALDKSIRYSFESIHQSTNGFCHRPYDYKTQIGTKVGEGRFSSVFRAKTYLESDSGNHSDAQLEVVAAKLLKSECKLKDLANEINLASKIRNEHILELLGIALGKSRSNQYDCICLVYPYMQNGSLADCLNSGVPLRNSDYISSSKRPDIALKVAKAINYLHTLPDGPIIHRDVKTANILIDTQLDPKLGDFTLVRQLHSGQRSMTQYSQNIIGTSVYMPPEAFRGDISTKFDTFSYGIVLFELLTGMRPFSEEHEEDLFTYITERLSDLDDRFNSNSTCNNTTGSNQHDDNIGKTIEEARDEFLRDSLDRRAGEWCFEKAKCMFRLALKATESRKKDRPEMSILLKDLESIVD